MQRNNDWDILIIIKTSKLVVYFAGIRHEPQQSNLEWRSATVEW